MLKTCVLVTVACLLAKTLPWDETIEHTRSASYVLTCVPLVVSMLLVSRHSHHKSLRTIVVLIAAGVAANGVDAINGSVSDYIWIESVLGGVACNVADLVMLGGLVAFAVVGIVLAVRDLLRPAPNRPDGLFS